MSHLFLHYLLPALTWPLHLIYIDVVTMVGFAGSNRRNVHYYHAAVLALISTMLVAIGALNTLLDHEFVDRWLSWDLFTKIAMWVMPGAIYAVFNMELESCSSTVMRLFISPMAGILVTVLIIAIF